MLKFFRRYQRIFFIFVAAIIIVSFSFFGSYSMLGGVQRAEDPVAFTAIDGSAIRQSELSRLVAFLSTDLDDALKGRVRGDANFLNDGVIRKDILASGLGSLIGGQYVQLLEEDLETRVSRERYFQPYRHPYANFLGAEAAWSACAPKLKSFLDHLLDAGMTAESFDQRVRLYLEEQRFPQEALKQIIRRQEQQVGRIPPDPHLEQRDLALFGYHTLEDWFGNRFISLVAQVIINGSILAEERGYVVTEDEAWVDLRRRAEMAYQSFGERVAARDGQTLLDGQLRRLGMDRTSATNLWKRVMLFRRLFQEAGSLALVDAFAFNKIAKFSGEIAEIAIYELPESLRLKNFADLAALECYLDAVSEERELFALPTRMRSKEAVWQSHPELIQKRFLVRVAQCSSAQSARRILVRDLLDWELEEANFATLADTFPGLLNRAPKTRTERHQALQMLDKYTRAKVDLLAQEEIVSKRPDWIDDDLASAPRELMTLAMTEWGGQLPLKGITDRRALRKALEENDELTRYSQDRRYTYHIEVLDRDAEESILTFAEAKELGVLSDLVDKRLSAYYEFLRAEAPAAYARADGTAKSLEEVRTQVARRMLDPLIQAIHADAVNAGQIATLETPTAEFATFNRFAHYLRGIRDTLFMTNREGDWLDTGGVEHDPLKLPARAPLVHQWKIKQRIETITRSHQSLPNASAAFDLSEGEWSKLFTQGRHGTYFFKVLNKAEGTASIDPAKVEGSQRVLSFEAQRCLGKKLLAQMEERGSVALRMDRTEREG